MSDITKIKVNGEPESSYQLYPRNEEFAKRSEGAQPDWNQNDETAEDHIKNRTHYEEVLDEYVIFEGTLPAYTSTTDLPLQYAIPSNTSVTAYYNGSIVATVVGRANAGTLSSWYWFSPDLDLTVDNSTMKASVYNGMGDGVLKFVVENFTIVHTLDEKYLPNNVKGMVNSKMNANNPVGTGSFSMGRRASSVVGTQSHAEGSETTASGAYSHAEGYNTTASGDYSHAEGNNTTASGDYSHAEGSGTTASGSYSHAEGSSTNKFSSVVTEINPTDGDIIDAWNSKKFSLANRSSSHVEGKDNLALGAYSHAEGYNTTASGAASHAEGKNTTASGDWSHAEGSSTTASGFYSHTEGEVTRASGRCQHVQGKFNVVDSQGKYAHIVGNGTSESARSNAHTLDWNGVPWFKGRPQFGGTAMDNGSQTVMANGDKEIILTSSTANSTKKFKITVDDSGTLTATEVI